MYGLFAFYGGGCVEYCRTHPFERSAAFLYEILLRSVGDFVIIIEMALINAACDGAAEQESGNGGRV